jgi:hypothetical protein
MKRSIPFLLLAFATAACQDQGPRGPADDPLFAKDKNCDDPKWENHPSCTGGGGPAVPTAQATLCAKQAVIEQINGDVWRANREDFWQFNGGAIIDGENVGSTGEDCGIADEDVPLTPSGTFTYTPEGPVFEWEFKGAGFPKPERGPAYGAHRYVLIIYDNPWPGGTGLKCLSSGIYDEAAIPNGKGRLTLQGTTELNEPLVDAKIWIVRWAWVDCASGQLRNDAVNPGSPPPQSWPFWPAEPIPDATYSLWGPYWNDGYGMFAYDWLFEATVGDLVNYIDTNDP